MGSNAPSPSEGEPGDHWARLDAFLQTDPRDVGCDTAMDMLDVYAELLAGGDDPTERFPGLHAHFSACGPCSDDLEGLLAALTREASHRPSPPA